MCPPAWSGAGHMTGNEGLLHELLLWKLEAEQGLSITQEDLRVSSMLLREETKKKMMCFDCPLQISHDYAFVLPLLRCFYKS
jgi:hypothetical protein